MKASELIAMIDTACGHNQDTLAESDVVIRVEGEEDSYSVLHIGHFIAHEGGEWVEVGVDK